MYDKASSLWCKTPLFYSIQLSATLNADVYLKLENLQPTQSFKQRGVSHFIQKALRDHMSLYGKSPHLLVASSGNAGLAAAYTARSLDMHCTVFLPSSSATPSTLAIFRREKAQVVVQGEVYSEARAAAEAMLASDPNAVLVPAYDNPTIWEGHASMIHELKEQLPHGTKPDAIFCNVGGGGLAGGIMVGSKAVGWDDVPLVTLETMGSNCFYASLALNEGPFPLTSRGTTAGVTAEYSVPHGVTTARLTKLTSRASSLGATSPSAAVVKMALDRLGGVRSVCVSDEMAMSAGVLFADDHTMLTELACAATLVPAYSPTLFDRLVPEREGSTKRTAVFVVCGGFKTSLAELVEYQVILKQHRADHWQVWCNGETWRIPR